MKVGLWQRVRASLGFSRPLTLKDPELYASAVDGGPVVSPQAVMQLDAAWACVRLISETIASLPLGMYERTPQGKRYAPQHPLHYLIHDQPNADSTATVFWEAVVASMLLRGAARIEKQIVAGRLVGLLLLGVEGATDVEGTIRVRDADGDKALAGLRWSKGTHSGLQYLEYSWLQLPHEIAKRAPHVSQLRMRASTRVPSLDLSTMDFSLERGPGLDMAER